MPRTEPAPEFRVSLRPGWSKLASDRATGARGPVNMPNQRQLLVLRHAKSSWDDSGLEDHERPLAQRGLRAVKLLGDHLRDTGVHPTQVLCSSARRTRETLVGVNPTGQ